MVYWAGMKGDLQKALLLEWARLATCFKAMYPRLYVLPTLKNNSADDSQQAEGAHVVCTNALQDVLVNKGKALCGMQVAKEFDYNIYVGKIMAFEEHQDENGDWIPAWYVEFDEEIIEYNNGTTGFSKDFLVNKLIDRMKLYNNKYV